MPESPTSESPRPIPPLKRHFPPPPPLAPRAPGLWRSTPPAIFPPIMGLFGLGLGWRVLADQPGLQPLDPIGEAILGATLLLAAFAVIAWTAKPLRRPAVILEDLRVLPGRAGLAGLALCIILSGAALVPYAPTAALTLAFTGSGLLAVVGGLIAWTLLTGPEEQRVVTPVFHLTYVGFILGPLTFARLGLIGLSTVILLATIVAALVIWGLSLHQLWHREPPAPLRPLLMIHLTPANFFTIVSVLTGHTTIAMAFAAVSLAILLALLVSLRWMLVAGFSPLWGALTFPTAACGTALILALGTPGLWLGGALLAVASALNPWVAFRVFKSWAKGDLAARTNAATA